MSSKDDSSWDDFDKKRKKKKCNCIIVLCCLFCGTIITALSYGAFGDSKFVGAPSDECLFTNTTSITENCRSTQTICNGKKRKLYYTTLDDTCAPNELYKYSECDCNDNPSTIPANYTNGTWDECWIIGCETDADWTFTEPQDQRVLGWILLVIGLILLGVSIFYFCKCLQSEFDDGPGMIEEIGEKETYDRFYKILNGKEGNDRPATWTTLHRVVISCSIAAPVIMVGSFLVATFTYGANLSDNTISTGVQYREEYDAMFRFTEFCTGLSTIFASFVSWCRQIQIAIYFREYATYFGAKQAKIYRWLNVIAVIFNVIGYFAIVQLVSYDSSRASDAHQLWAGIAFLSTGSFLGLTMCITVKQRHVEYRRNKIVDEQSSCIALKNTFWYDAVIMFILFISGIIALFIFFGEISYQRSKLSEEEKVNTSKYVRDFGNTAEWVAFFSLVSGVGVLALSFHHDHVSWEIHDYLKQEVMLWPCANNIVKFLSCCCCCCCEVPMLRKSLEIEIVSETEMNTMDDEVIETQMKEND